MVFLLKIHFIRGYYIGKIVLTVLILQKRSTKSNKIIILITLYGLNFKVFYLTYPFPAFNM